MITHDRLEEFGYLQGYSDGMKYCIENEGLDGIPFFSDVPQGYRRGFRESASDYLEILERGEVENEEIYRGIIGNIHRVLIECEYHPDEKAIKVIEFEVEAMP